LAFPKFFVIFCSSFCWRVSKYQQTNADEDSNADVQSRQDKRTVNALKTDTQVDKEMPIKAHRKLRIFWAVVTII
jgi:hypothetical protein